jgi:hypothetical protein
MSKQKWGKGTVAIKRMQHVDGKLQYVPHEVQCIKRGIWAIHKGLGYIITHAPSGMKFTELRTQRDCKALVDEISFIEWVDTPNTMPHFAHLEAAKPILQKYVAQMR